MGITIETIIYAVIGGFLPALIWLYFWLKEDKDCPEPFPLLLLAFIGGMIAVPLVLPFQKMAEDIFPAGPMVIFAWAAIEEVMKYIAASITVLWRKAVNEPIDGLVYMLTVALGFAALENTFFLLNPITQGSLVDSFVTGNLRFLGATLLHVVASSMVGVAIAFSFYRTRFVRTMYISSGLILAILLHTTFNILILSKSGVQTLGAFLFVWLGVVTLFILFEIARWLRTRRLPKNRKNVC